MTNKYYTITFRNTVDLQEVTSALHILLSLKYTYTGNEHSTSYHFVFTVLYFYPLLMFILYIMVNSLHHKYTMHCMSETFSNAQIFGVGSISIYSVLCADISVFLASCWSQSLSSGCQSASIKPLLKFFVKLHCSSNILKQPDSVSRIW